MSVGGYVLCGFISCGLVGLAGCVVANENSKPLPVLSSDTASIDTAMASPDQVERSCPAFDDALVVANVLSSEVSEASGLVASRLNPGVFWLHNDSGGLPRLFAVNKAGQLVATVTLEGAEAIDWEDMAIGPGPEAEKNYLYVGDIGDNQQLREEIQVYRFVEPLLAAGLSQNISISEFDRFALTYPDSPQNAEGMVVTDDGLLWILSKTFSGESVAYSARLEEGLPTVMEVGLTMKLRDLGAAGVPIVTAADISPNGEWLALRTYDAGYLLPVSVLYAPEGLQDVELCPLETAVEPQGESIAFAPDGSAIFTLSEGLNMPIYQYTMQE